MGPAAAAIATGYVVAVSIRGRERAETRGDEGRTKEAKMSCVLEVRTTLAILVQCKHVQISSWLTVIIGHALMYR